MLLCYIASKKIPLHYVEYIRLDFVKILACMLLNMAYSLIRLNLSSNNVGLHEIHVSCANLVLECDRIWYGKLRHGIRVTKIIFTQID